MPAGTTSEALAGDVFSSVVGQPGAVAVMRASAKEPVHAYLLVGPPGSGLRDAGVAFATALVCPDGGCGHCAHCLQAAAGSHPDISIFERSGASLSVPQATEAVRRSLRSPRSARRHVVLLTELHLVETAAPVLLKAIEEPPASTVFVLLADEIPPELETISSRCARVELRPLDESTVEQALVAEGADPPRARAVAAASGGRLDRARLLVADEGFAARQELWTSVPDHLDGTGARVAALAGSLLASISEPVEVLRTEQAGELRLLEARAAERREPLRGRAEIEARHRREQRRVRTDELRAGLITLARALRDALVRSDVSSHRVAFLVEAVSAIDAAADALVRNPNEQLLLEALLLRLTGERT